MIREVGFIEDNMTQDIDATCKKMKIDIVLMIGAISKKETFKRMRLEFVMIIGA